VSAGWIFTDHSAYGVSVAARSVPTALSRSVAVPGAVETPAFCSAALGVEDKVSDQPQEIQAVSVTVCHQCHEQSHGAINDVGLLQAS
jgi:cytochrome c553